MTGRKGMHHFGRPKMLESDLAKFRLHNFYFPLRLEDVWDEFDLLSQRQIKNFAYPQRCKSIILRRLIFDFILKHTIKEDIKHQINNFVEEENNLIKKLKK
jgi:hypothetical protein